MSRSNLNRVDGLLNRMEDLLREMEMEYNLFLADLEGLTTSKTPESNSEIEIREPLLTEHWIIEDDNVRWGRGRRGGW